MTFIREKAVLGKITAIVALTVFCSIVVTILLITLPASAQEKAEQRVKDQMKGEFENIKRVQFMGEEEGQSGKLEHYFIYDDKDEAIGFVKMEASSGKVKEIAHEPAQNYGEPQISEEEAIRIATDYLEKWGYSLTTEYVLKQEGLEPLYSDIGDKHQYTYRFLWEKQIGDVSVTGDICYIDIDAVDGQILYCYFPTSNDLADDSIAKMDEDISREEALEIARRSIPSTEDWYSHSAPSMSGESSYEDVNVIVEENCEKSYRDNDGG
ncbi:MAG: hypothetical protein HPY75_07015 [Actinobacteria bacterium]|nr:hypothetical protein [Actinomycetota bacterium]